VAPGWFRFVGIRDRAEHPEPAAALGAFEHLNLECSPQNQKRSPIYTRCELATGGPRTCSRSACPTARIVGEKRPEGAPRSIGLVDHAVTERNKHSGS
jgi:hypothetical protein